MKKSRFNEEQIIGILKQHEAGQKMADLAREHGISEATMYTWKSKYGGMDVSEAQRLKALDDENRRLKHAGRRSQPRQRDAESGDPKKRVELAGLRQDVAFVAEQFAVSERRACKLFAVDRSTYRYEPQPDRNAQLRGEMIALARQKPRYGYRRLHALLNRQGQTTSPMRLFRLYQEEGLAVRRLKRKRLSRPAARVRLACPAEPGMGD